MPDARPGRYQIALPEFSGPLDLLLHLIERSELDITAISLAQVTGQYLEQVERLKEGTVDQLIDFLVVGARLVLIKSRALLPQPPAAPAGEAEEEDPAELLARQLRQYRQFKAAAAWLAERERRGLRSYLRVAPPPRLENRLDLSGLTVEALLGAMRGALERAEAAQESVAIARPRTLTVEGQIRRLQAAVAGGETVTFRELLPAETTALELAVTLMAVLELVKRGEISARQQVAFGAIEIAAATPDPVAAGPPATGP